MRGQIRLGRFFGVEVGLHYSWVFIAVLIVISLAAHFRAVNSDWSSTVVLASAVLTAILFFVSLVAHELSHSVVARANGLPVRSITLFALGGVAQIEREAQNAKTEFWMAIVGPISSLVIGAICLLAASVFGWHFLGNPATPGLAILIWLGYINISLAVFNMIPGFPLDGGRVLHAIIWWITGSANRSLRIASQTGRVVALLFIAYGVFRYMTGGGFGALWIAFIGWFLLQAAGSSYAQVRVAEALRGVRVRDLMVRDCPAVGIHTNLQSFIVEQMLPSARLCFIITDGELPVGLLTPADVQAIPRPQWLYHTVGDVMRPIENMRAISPDTPVTEALETMGREHVSQLAVASEGRFEGIISRASVLGFLQARAHLNI